MQTNKPRFTPGPWELDGESIIRRNDHNDLYRMLIDVETHSAFQSEDAANRNLLLAAPDLYEAVELLLRGVRGDVPLSNAVLSAEIALQRARGEITDADLQPMGSEKKNLAVN